MAEYVNIRPDSFAEGGGLVDDFDGTISDARFVMTDYNGQSADMVPVARVVFDIDGEEVDPILYSVGGTGDFTPDETGMRLVKLKTKSTLTKSSKFGMFMASLIEVGFPLNRMDSENVSYLVGLRGHFLRKAVEYKGLKKKNERDSTVLLCSKIITLPGEGAAKGAAKSGKAKASADPELATAVTEIVQGIILEAGGEIAKKNLISALFKDDDLNALSDKKAALKLASDDGFLKGCKEWTYEDGILRIG